MMRKVLKRLKTRIIFLSFNPFVPNVPFLYPSRFLDVSRGQRKGALGTIGLMVHFKLF